jgi:hypothetical protein
LDPDPLLFPHTEESHPKSIGVQWNYPYWLEVPEHYDEMIANSNSTIFCTLDLCEYGDGMCDQDDDTLELLRREFKWIEKVANGISRSILK